MNSITLINLCQNQTSQLSETFIVITTKNTGVTKSVIRVNYKFLDDVFSISGICLVAIGTITGGITLNPVVLGVVNGAGVVVEGIGKKKNYKRKIEMSRIAFTTYEKVLVELRAALRGDEWNKQDFVDRMKLIDEMIIDQFPIADRFAIRYSEKFNINI